MSLAQKPIEPVLVYDDRLDFNNPKYYSVLKGGTNNTYKRWVPTSANTNNITWTATPPSGSASVMDRRVFVRIPIRATLRFRNLDTAGVNFALDAYTGRIGPRNFPIAKACSSIRASINNVDITTNLGDYMNLLQMYMDNNASMGAYSMTPTAYDKFDYTGDDDLNSGFVGLSENPLSGWGNGGQNDVNPGRFGETLIKIVTNPAIAIGGSGDVIIDMVITEPIIMSPFVLSDKTNAMGFYNVSSFTLSLNFYSNAVNRIMEIIPFLPVDPNVINLAASNKWEIGSQVTGPQFSFTESQPYLFCNYLLPPARLALGPSSITQYPYFNYVLESTNCNSGDGTATSNNFQLASIPRRVYIAVCPSAGSLSQTISVPDTYLKIKSVQIQFENSQSIFAEADIAILYQMAIKNGYIGSYLDFTKGPVYYAGQDIGNGVVAPVLYRSGTVLSFEFGTDIQLQSEFEAPGSVSGKQYNFQVTVTYEQAPIDYVTVFNALQVPNLQYQVQCLFAYEGVFNILGQGMANTQINVLSENDVINAMEKDGIKYSDVASVQGGAINFSNLKDMTKNLVEGAKKINKELRDKKLISNVADAVSQVANRTPLPYAQQVGTAAADVRDIAQRLGYGSGGVLLGTGGAYASKSKLAKKMRQ